MQVRDLARETMRVVGRIEKGAGLLALAVLGGWVGWACLPDLAPLPRAAASYCGDGVVDWQKDSGPGEECDPGEAGAPGCSNVCTIDCPSGGIVDPRSQHCYFLRDQAASLREANAACRAEGAHVVTFASEDEYRFVHTWFTSVTRPADAFFWIGLEGNATTAYAYLSTATDEPGFAAPDASVCEGCYGRVPDGGQYFAVPDGGATAPRQFLCVVATRLAQLPWYQAACSLPTRGPVTVCEREPLGSRASPCDGGRCVDVPRTQGTKRYVLVTTPATASAAASACKAFAAGSLVVFDTREEREQVGREVARLLPRDGTPASTFWIGLSSQGGAWRWDDGRPAAAVPPVWGDFEPRPGASAARAYVELGPPDDYDTSLAHADGDAARARPFVCQLR
jgi:hypothetical protein